MRELLAAGKRRVDEIWLIDGTDPAAILGEIDNLARKRRVPVRMVSPRKLESVQRTESPQGVVAFAEPIESYDLVDLVFGPNGEEAASEARASVARETSVSVTADEDNFIEGDDDEEDNIIDFADFEEEDSGDSEDLSVSDLTDSDDTDDTDHTDHTDNDESGADLGTAGRAEDTDSAGPLNLADDAATAAAPDGLAVDAYESAAPVENLDTDATADSGLDLDAPVPGRTVANLPPTRPQVGKSGGKGRVAFLVVVDGVTDPHNLGAILRSAECAGATGVVLPRHRAVHVTAAVAKAAAGAVEHLPIALVGGIPSALAELAQMGVRTIGLDEHGTESLFDLHLGDEPVALVLGAEGRGLAPLSKRRCDVLAQIPIHGHLPSLNVSTAAAIACFEVAKGRKPVAG